MVSSQRRVRCKECKRLYKKASQDPESDTPIDMKPPRKKRRHNAYASFVKAHVKSERIKALPNKERFKVIAAMWKEADKDKWRQQSEPEPEPNDVVEPADMKTAPAPKLPAIE